MKAKSKVPSEDVERRAVKRSHYLVLRALGECVPGHEIGNGEWAWRFGSDVFVVRRSEASSSYRGQLVLIRLKSYKPSEYRLACRWRVVSSLGLRARSGSPAGFELRSFSDSRLMDYKEWLVWVKALCARRHERREASSSFVRTGVRE